MHHMKSIALVLISDVNGLWDMTSLYDVIKCEPLEKKNHRRCYCYYFYAGSQVSLHKTFVIIQHKYPTIFINN